MKIFQLFSRLADSSLVNCNDLLALAVKPRRGNLSHFKSERDIVVCCEMGIKCIALEYHRYISVLGVNVIDQLIINIQLTAADLLQTCNHTQRR